MSVPSPNQVLREKVVRIGGVGWLVEHKVEGDLHLVDEGVLAVRQPFKRGRVRLAQLDALSVAAVELGGAVLGEDAALAAASLKLGELGFVDRDL
jgi:hypothetical protein